MTLAIPYPFGSGTGVGRQFFNQLEADLEYLLGNVRERLTAARTYYVRTDGSDSNTGLVNTAGGAFLTLQKPMDVISGNLDLGIYDVTVQVGAGTYGAGVTLKTYQTGGGKVIYTGDLTTPSNVIVSINTSNTGCFQSTFPTIGDFQVGGFRVINPTGLGVILQGRKTSALLRSMDFNNCGGHCNATYGAFLTLGFTNYVSAGAITGFNVDRQAQIFASGSTLVYSNAPAYSAWNFSVQSGAWFDCWGMTFTNGATVTGRRYFVDGLGGMFTNGGGINYVPGNVAGGAPTNGGLYF